MTLVYMAGPITGCDYSGATEWREKIRFQLEAYNIKALSPMRRKPYLKNVKEFTHDGDAYKELSVLSSNRGIMTRDRWDAMRCDILLVNLLGAKKVSIGTVMEVAWADARRTPIVVVMENEGNPHEHGMIAEATGFRVRTLDEAVEIIRALAGD